MQEEKKYIVKKVFNNNVIFVQDKETLEELVLVGRGIGFGKKDGKIVQLKKKEIEKSFLAFDQDTKKDYYQLIKQLNGRVMGVSEEIIALAEKEFGTLNSHIHIALTDHIGFALDRIKMGLAISNPFIYEIKALYPEEFRVGEKAKKIINSRLGVAISEDEVGFIALHIHSARQNKMIRESIRDTKLLKSLVNIIEEELKVTIDGNNLLYNRLISHLKVTINRVTNKRYINNPLLDSIKERFGQSYEVAEKIGHYIEKKKNLSVTEDELGYMTLHIERIKETLKFERERVTESNQA